MKLLYFLILAFVLTIVAASLTFFALTTMSVIQEQTFLMDVSVTDSGVIGFNVDPDGFHFGSMSSGNSASRTLVIHQVEQDSLVTIKTYGEMADWVVYPDNFIISKGEQREIFISVIIPEDTPQGDYTGTIKVALTKA